MKFLETNYGDMSQEIFNDDINASKLGLTSLEGSPKDINGEFNCSLNYLTDELIEGNYNVSHNRIIELQGLPKIIKQCLFLNSNKLMKILFLNNSQIGSHINLSNNRIKLLEGSPNIVNGDFDCENNLISTLEKCPEIVKGDFSIKNNRLLTLYGNLKEVEGTLDISKNKKLENPKQQIIWFGIKANNYITDDGIFTFDDIKKDFDKRKIQRERKLKSENNKKINKNNILFNKTDYGLAI